MKIKEQYKAYLKETGDVLYVDIFLQPVKAVEYIHVKIQQELLTNE